MALSQPTLQSGSTTSTLFFPAGCLKDAEWSKIASSHPCFARLGCGEGGEEKALIFKTDLIFFFNEAQRHS